MEAEAVRALLPDGAGERLPLWLAAAEALPAPKMLAVCGCEGAADGDNESDALGDAEGRELPLSATPVREPPGDPLPRTLSVPLTVPASVARGDVDWCAVSEVEGEAAREGSGELDADTEGVAERDGAEEGDEGREAESRGEAVVEGEGRSVLPPVEDGVGEGVVYMVTVPPTLWEGKGVLLSLPAAEGEVPLDAVAENVSGGDALFPALPLAMEVIE